MPRAWLFRKNFYDKLSEPGWFRNGRDRRAHLLTFPFLPVLYEIVETKLVHRGAALT